MACIVVPKGILWKKGSCGVPSSQKTGRCETFGQINNTTLPLAVLVHGFPDTPFTWRRLGPQLAERRARRLAR